MFISHRMSSAQFCEKIVAFDKSRIFEYGTHAKLMEEKGFYEELYHMQAQFYMQEERQENETEIKKCQAE